jgi:hypothetical protein
MEQRMGTMPPQVNEQKNAIVGKTVTIVKEGGVFKLAEKPAEGELKEDDLDLGAEVEAFLPESAVGVGETWTVKPEKVKQVFGGENAPKKTTVTCTLQELTGSGAERKAKIHVKVEMETDTPGGKMTMQMEGPMIFDLAAGKALSMSVKGKAKMDSPMGALEGPMEMEASLTPAE